MRASVCGSPWARLSGRVTPITKCAQLQGCRRSCREQLLQPQVILPLFPYSNPDHVLDKSSDSHTQTETRKQNPAEHPHLPLPSLLNPPHTLPLNIQPPNLPPPLPPQRLPHLFKLPLPKPQQPSSLHFHPLLERELRLYRSQFVVVAEKAELDIVVSGAAYDVVPARADFVQEVGCAWGDVADWGGDGVGAADADGFVHVAHDGRCIWYIWVC